jgi:hypothetical protein
LTRVVANPQVSAVGGNDLCVEFQGFAGAAP